MKVVVAVTGASGGVYARKCLEQLLLSAEVEQVALVVSDKAQQVLAFEGVELPQDERIALYSNDDMFAPAASGSAGYDAMVVVPASMGSVGRMASGVSSSTTRCCGSRNTIFAYPPTQYDHPDRSGSRHPTRLAVVLLSP